MPPRMAIVWIPVAIGLATAVVVMLVIWLRREITKRHGPDESDESDGGGGGGRRRPPQGPPPAGPVSWPDFEREFADYVRACSSAPTGADAGAAGSADPRGSAPVRLWCVRRCPERVPTATLGPCQRQEARPHAEPPPLTRRGAHVFQKP